jgi:putative DNA primase/helicase
MHQDFFDFLPSHLILVLSNHLPAVKEGGEAFWRRVRLIPFKHVVPEDQQIKHFHDHLLAADGPAILGWAVRGAVELLANGLQDPDKLIRATHEYKVSEDTLAGFVEDQCMIGQHWHCAVPDLRARYVKHCEEMDSEPLSARALSMRLVNEFGVTLDRQARRRLYRGITLMTDDT